MRRILTVLLATILPLATAGGCLTADFMFPLTFDLTRTVASDFVLYASNSLEILSVTEAYIADEGWSEAVRDWMSNNEDSHTVVGLTNAIDLFFRSALRDCHGVHIEGELYSPPSFRHAVFYALMLGEACVCFDELTNYLFVSK